MLIDYINISSSSHDELKIMALTNYRDIPISKYLFLLTIRVYSQRVVLTNIFAALCREDRLWKDKIRLKFKKGGDLLKHKPEDIS